MPTRVIRIAPLSWCIRLTSSTSFSRCSVRASTLASFALGASEPSFFSARLKNACGDRGGGDDDDDDE